MDCQGIWCRHSWCPQDESWVLFWSSELLSRATSESACTLQWNIYLMNWHKMWHRLSWSVTTVKLSSGIVTEVQFMFTYCITQHKSLDSESRCLAQGILHFCPSDTLGQPCWETHCCAAVWWELSGCWLLGVIPAARQQWEGYTLCTAADSVELW